MRYLIALSVFLFLACAEDPTVEVSSVTDTLHISSSDTITKIVTYKDTVYYPESDFTGDSTYYNYNNIGVMTSKYTDTYVNGVLMYRQQYNKDEVKIAHYRYEYRGDTTIITNIF